MLGGEKQEEPELDLGDKEPKSELKQKIKF
jgi:hypothetical protein